MAELPSPIPLGLVVDGIGSHPAAWRLAPEQARAAYGARYHLDQVRLAERGGFDFVIFEDRYGSGAADGPAFRGRLDAALLAARLAPVTERIGLVPTFAVTHAEPFHVSKSVATLDHASLGRAGWLVGISTDPVAADLIGRRSAPDSAEAWREAAEAADVVQRLWDSWEDDAEIRDVATGRFVDADRLHYVDFAGDHFSVKGPSITPRPPQGQPPTFVRTADPNAEAVIGHGADVVVSRLAGPDDRGGLDDHHAFVRDVRELVAEAGRPEGAVTVLAELDVTVAASAAEAAEVAGRLDEAIGGPRREDAGRFVGSADRLAEFLGDTAPLVGGFVINFSVLPTQLPIFVDRVLPRVPGLGGLAAESRTGSLRSTFGLGRPVNRYATEPRAEAAPDPAPHRHCDRCAATAAR
ncbi:LLM class flavin-dependent oxidoreductase [Microlunatus sp. GCM10028923]|uniref:LLM class flavin-dependent oxidoreductase n=1 Tax=Microlunatus sp. GCM10028923 TaxID=3273400 RepID=UPI003616D3D7